MSAVTEDRPCQSGIPSVPQSGVDVQATIPTISLIVSWRLSMLLLCPDMAKYEEVAIQRSLAVHVERFYSLMVLWGRYQGTCPLLLG